MPTQIAVRKAKTKAVKKALTGPGALAQEALQVTWLLKGNLKNEQLSHIRVGKLLARVRDEKLYAALNHPDIETYAWERLKLKRTGLYQHLRVHDWIAEFHPDWLKPKPKGFIPELNDVDDLIWIERELTRKDLTQESQTGLKELKKKALSGQLSKAELIRFRRQGNKIKDARKAFISKMRLLRMRGSQLAGMPSEVITHLDAAIEILKNAVAPASAGTGGI